MFIYIFGFTKLSLELRELLAKKPHTHTSVYILTEVLYLNEYVVVVLSIMSSLKCAESQKNAHRARVELYRFVD